MTIQIQKTQQNTFEDNDIVCHCFGYSKKDIIEDFIKNDSSIISVRIAKEKKANGCDCKAKNPKGI